MHLTRLGRGQWVQSFPPTLQIMVDIPLFGDKEDIILHIRYSFIGECRDQIILY